MYITKKEFNIIKTLKRFLSIEEYKDFKLLFKNRNVSKCIIEIGNSVIIDYYNYNVFVYSMIIERTLGFRAKIELEKSNIDLIEKLLSNKEIVALVKQLKDYDTIHINNREIVIFKGKYSITIPLKPSLKTLKSIKE